LVKIDRPPRSPSTPGGRRGGARTEFSRTPNVDADQGLLGIEHEFRHNACTAAVLPTPGAPPEHERGAGPVGGQTQAQSACAESHPPRPSRLPARPPPVCRARLQAQRCAISFEHARPPECRSLGTISADLRLGHGTEPPDMMGFLCDSRRLRQFFQRRNAAVLRLRHARKIMRTTSRVRSCPRRALKFLLDVPQALGPWPSMLNTSSRSEYSFSRTL